MPSLFPSVLGLGWRMVGDEPLLGSFLSSPHFTFHTPPTLRSLLHFVHTTATLHFTCLPLHTTCTACLPACMRQGRHTGRTQHCQAGRRTPVPETHATQHFQRCCNKHIMAWYPGEEGKARQLEKANGYIVSAFFCGSF